VSFAAAVPQDAEGLRRPGGPLRGCARAYCFGGAAEEAVSSIFGLRLTVYGLPMTGSNTAKCDGDAACHTNQITNKCERWPKEPNLGAPLREKVVDRSKK